MLTVKVQPPRVADVLRKNPLGLYVDAIDWSRELETPADRAVPPEFPSPSDLLPSADMPLGSPLDQDIAKPEIPLRSEEHTSELQSLMRLSYAVSCLKTKKHDTNILKLTIN